MENVEETQTDVDRLAELERKQAEQDAKQAEQDAKQAEQAAEIERLSANDPVTKAEALLMYSPVPMSARVREQMARQHGARLERVRAAEAVDEEAALEARVRAPEVAKHQRKLAELDEQIVEKRDTFERAARELAELERERFRVAAEAPVFTKPSPGRPIKVGDDPGDRRRWRLGGAR